MTATDVVPLTYPARPLNGGPLPLAMRFKKPGRWLYEPKVNGWRAQVHVPTGAMFNRAGEPLSIGGEFTKALANLRELDIADWLDCEGLNRRHAVGKGVLVILDVPVPGLTYLQRRAMIAGRALSLSLEQLLGAGDVRCLPQIEEDHALEAWEKLQARNKHLGCEFYEGLVAKRADSPYPMQLRSPDTEFPGWVKHRWAF